MNNQAHYAILTGAGFSDNWGQWLASELWAKVKQHNPFAIWTYKWKVYRKIPPKDLLIQSKRHTHNIEAQKSSLRDSIRDIIEK